MASRSPPPVLHAFIDKTPGGEVMRVWGERDGMTMGASRPKKPQKKDRHHPRALLKQELQELCSNPPSPDRKLSLKYMLCTFRLPTDASGPIAAHEVLPKRIVDQTPGMQEQGSTTLEEWQAWCCCFLADEFPSFIKVLDKHGQGEFQLGASMRYWLDLARVGIAITRSGSFIPELQEFVHPSFTIFAATWIPWWNIMPQGLAASWAESMPISCIANRDELVINKVDPESALGIKVASMTAFLGAIINHTIHAVFARTGYIDTLEKFPLSEATFKARFGFEQHAFRERLSLKKYTDWLQELVWGRGARIEIEKDRFASYGSMEQVLHDAAFDFARWTGQEPATYDARPWLPVFVVELANGIADPNTLPRGTAGKPGAPEPSWKVSMQIIRNDGTGSHIPASDAWVPVTDTGQNTAARDGQLRHLILTVLFKASNIFGPFREFLSQDIPGSIHITPAQVYDLATRLKPAFIREGLLLEGIEWIGKDPGIGLVIKVGGRSFTGESCFDLSSLLDFDWQVAIGEDTISMAEFEGLVKQNTPLVKFRDKWLEISGSMRSKMQNFTRGDKKQLKLNLGRALRLGLGREQVPSGLRVVRVEGEGRVKDFLERLTAGTSLEPIPPPRSLAGSLRPYQQRGLDWLAFLTKYGLGACLADDMGLGKTIQAIALLLHDKEGRDGSKVAERHAIVPDPVNVDDVPPSHPVNLIICPVSVIGNWFKELNRFAPDLKVMIHHGSSRMNGNEFAACARQTDVILTSYALIARDEEDFMNAQWNYLILDEAQNIKNHNAKQTRSIKNLQALHKIALTGTPVENRLAELWSIVDFLNPDYLGSVEQFHSAFELPISRNDDGSVDVLSVLKRIIRPFILRRVKSDKTLVPELPDKIEIPEYCTITREQASLYQALVNEMFKNVDGATPMERKGLILATLMKLKQVCDHPEVFLKENGKIVGRSQKLARLEELVERVLDAREKCIIFTQFVRMGEIIASHLKYKFNQEILFMHGSIPAHERENMIRMFQDGKAGGPAIFVLTLKTGGSGLNLTAANNVFHYDRWWNPAVENQATDRTHRIGQDRKVTVFKFICTGTIEEHINKMIEEKTALAANVIDQGDKWITEMSTDELKHVFELRGDIVREGGSNGCLD